MDRVIQITCILLILVNIYIEMVVATTRYESSMGSNKDKEEDNTVPPDGSRLGRRKRNSKGDVYKVTQQELAELWEVLTETPATVVTIDANDKFICRSLLGNRFYLIEGKCDKIEFVPRLGRNTDIELLGNEKWLRDVNGEVDERSPPFAPRLGRKISPYSSKLGREV